MTGKLRLLSLGTGDPLLQQRFKIGLEPQQGWCAKGSYRSLTKLLVGFCLPNE